MISERHIVNADTSLKDCILNNDTGQFRCKGEEDEDIIADKAVKIIVEKALNLNIDKKRHLEQWETSRMERKITEEGHNIMILSKLFKNVFVRWNTDFEV